MSLFLFRCPPPIRLRRPRRGPRISRTGPAPHLAGHRIDRVRDQVQKHLLQLDSISSYLRYLCIRLGLDQYPVPLQIAARQGKGFPDEVVDVERSSVWASFLKIARMLPITAPARWPSATICLNAAFTSSRSGIERSSQQARIGIRYHPRQGLRDLVSNRGRDCVPDRQPRLALAALGEDRAE